MKTLRLEFDGAFCEVDVSEELLGVHPDKEKYLKELSGILVEGVLEQLNPKREDQRC